MFKYEVRIEETRVTSVIGGLDWSSSTVSVSGAIRGYAQVTYLDTCQYLGACLRWSKLFVPPSLTLSLTVQTPLHLIKENINFLSSDPETALNLVKR